MPNVRHFYVLGAFIFFFALTSQADINDGIISAWTFDDGTARDTAGNSDGELMGAAAITDGGKFGKGLDLDGTDSFVEVPHDGAFDDMADAFTVSAWAFVRQGRDHSAIAWKGAGIGWGANFAFRIATTSDVNITWGTCPIGIEGWFATNGAIAANEWLHVCLTADGTEAIGYVNAEIPISAEGNPRPVGGPYQTFPDEPIEFGVGRHIGALDNGVFNYLDGIVDEVYIYDRALSADEVAELSAGGRPDSFLAVEPTGKTAVTWGALKQR